jgi:hypothetical protein
MPREASSRTKRAPNREPTSLARGSHIQDSQIDPELLSQVPESLPLTPQAPGPQASNLYAPASQNRSSQALDSQASSSQGPDSSQTPAPDSQASSRTPYSQAPDSNKWTPELEKLMLDELVHQVVDLGKRADSGFKKEAWVGVLDYIAQEIGQVLSLERRKNKLDALKTYWRGFNFLKEQSGFGYNEETSLITAPDHVWNAICVTAWRVTPLIT